MNTKSVTIALLLIVVGIAMFFYIKSDMQDSEVDLSSQAMEDQQELELEDGSDETTYQYEGALLDVTKGETVTGINTNGDALGTAQSKFENDRYELLATFENLPDPVGSDFYEGWIVRKGLNFDVISTGVVEKIDGVYQNTFSADADLTDHDFYVLTIEPDDGDPAPAEHIIEGTMVSIQ